MQEVLSMGSIDGEIENNKFIFTRTRDKQNHEMVNDKDGHCRPRQYYQQLSHKYGEKYF